jgi:C4-type Zn-finger protein
MVQQVKIVDEKPFGFEFECSGCKSRLVAELEDVQVGYFGANYGGDRPERTYYITCPVCGTDKTLRHNEVTPKARAMADKKEKEKK